MSKGVVDVLVKYCGRSVTDGGHIEREDQSYKNLFNQVRQHLLEQGQGRIGSIEGELYPPTLINATASQLLSYIFMIGLFLVVLGEWFFTSVLPSEPVLKLVRIMKENQIFTMIILMGCNMLANQLLSTGAFEVYYNDTIVFSRLDTGLVPDPNYLLDRLKNFRVTDSIGEY